VAAQIPAYGIHIQHCEFHHQTQFQTMSPKEYNW
jgi:hypothetical protein